MLIKSKQAVAAIVSSHALGLKIQEMQRHQPNRSKVKWFQMTFWHLLVIHKFSTILALDEYWLCTPTMAAMEWLKWSAQALALLSSPFAMLILAISLRASLGDIPCPQKKHNFYLFRIFLHSSSTQPRFPKLESRKIPHFPIPFYWLIMDGMPIMDDSESPS